MRKEKYNNSDIKWIISVIDSNLEMQKALAKDDYDTFFKLCESYGPAEYFNDFFYHFLGIDTLYKISCIPSGYISISQYYPDCDGGAQYLTNESGKLKLTIPENITEIQRNGVMIIDVDILDLPHCNISSDNSILNYFDTPVDPMTVRIYHDQYDALMKQKNLKIGKIEYKD